MTLGPRISIGFNPQPLPERTPMEPVRESIGFARDTIVDTEAFWEGMRLPNVAASEGPTPEPKPDPKPAPNTIPGKHYGPGGSGTIDTTEGVG